MQTAHSAARQFAAVATMCFSLAACGRADIDPPAEAAACGIDYAATKAAEMAAIDAGGAIVGKLVLGELAEEDLTDDQIASLAKWEEILDDRTRPVDTYDVQILDVAYALLSGPEAWDRADDRECEPEDETFSLFCSLYFASLEVTGLYQHRRTVMQEVRFVIDDLAEGREFQHRLMDYNNSLETSLDDIKGVITTARQTVQERLQLQADCSL